MTWFNVWMNLRPLLMKHLAINTGLLLLSLASWLPTARSDDVAITFEKDVRPLLKAYCIDCHGGGEKLNGGLDLRLRRFAVRGGESGAAVVPGEPANSLLVTRLKSGEMPPGQKKVPPDKIAVLAAWIKTGAPTTRDEPNELPPGIDISPTEREYWFFQPPRRLTPLNIADAERIRSPIDAFILAKLEKQGLGFNPDADALTLIRRAAFDLTGLPPTQSEIDEFLADQSARAYENLLDRLLASPHYGERWGRHWLDVAGYADSEGNTNAPADMPRLWAWKYRDYVVRAFNADTPLDQFIREQLAGDELVPLPWKNLNDKPGHVDLLAATGYLQMAPDSTQGGGVLEANQALADTLKILGSSLMGLTIGCAQCHDHRFDPIPQSDYYRLRAVFEPALDPARWRRSNQRLVSLYTDAQRAQADAIEAQARELQKQYNAQQDAFVKAAFEKGLADVPEEKRAALKDAFETPDAKRTPEQKKLLTDNPKPGMLANDKGSLDKFDKAAAEELKKLQAGITAKRAEKPVEEFVAVANEPPGPVPVTKVFHRGDHLQPLQEVQPGDLTIAASEGQRFEITAKSAPNKSTQRRTAFANHLTSGEHPLLSRVLVNRIWQHHFGQGIVTTTGDFGTQGARPSHPELLDWLATELVQQGWSLKKFHKLIMTSTVYRQSSQRTSAQDRVDGTNVLLGRYPLRRLEAEAVRDRMLLTSGSLDRKLFGAPIPIKEDAVGQVIAPPDQPRRSLYLQVRRSKPLALLAAFDAPAMDLNCERRGSSTTAPQALMLMNGEFVLQQAELFARRIQSEVTADLGLNGRIAHAWRLAFQRSATADEIASAIGFVEGQLARHRAAAASDPELAALTNLCQQLISANEFLYAD